MEAKLLKRKTPQNWKNSGITGPKIILLLALLVPATISPLSAQDRDIPKVEDFTGSLTLTGTGGGLLKLELPEPVYQGVTRPDWGDIRVFDADGLLVPFMIRPAPGSVVEPPPEEVPVFPWERENSLPVGTDIVINAEGAVLDIKSRSPGPSVGSAWLLDISGLSRRPSLLHVVMGSGEDYYNTTARLYSSTDLARWREFEKTQTLARFGDNATGRDTLELPVGDNRYLLLRFDRPNLPSPNITALFERLELPPETREKNIHGEWQSEDRHVVRFFTGGFYPLRMMNFPLSRTDSIEALVKNRFAVEDEWSFVARTRLFRIAGGAKELQNEALDINSRAPWWELEALGDIAFSSMPGCTIRWAVYELIFLGRGTGPWTLAWGSDIYGPQETVLELPELSGGMVPSIGNALPLGDARYRERPAKLLPARDWGRFILWGSLIFATVLLSALALYIAISTKKDNSG
jgi:hypothetical protein